ncbi:hypothetical protein NY08_176 [Rhodococcus sp. B7740]|nr:hypothetical protein NY08_176 [Rhodococcus sp. B7740]
MAVDGSFIGQYTVCRFVASAYVVRNAYWLPNSRYANLIRGRQRLRLERRI